MTQYKSHKVTAIMCREGNIPEYAGANAKTVVLDFPVKFNLVSYPELNNQIKLLHDLYECYDADIQEEELVENFNTCNIEGAQLSTLDETREILKAPREDKKSWFVQGYSKAVETMKRLKETPINIDYINAIHEAVITYDPTVKKGYRDNSVFVGNDLEIVFKPCDCAFIEAYMSAMFSAFKYDIFVNAALLHFLMVWVHPYFDGNGRCARLIMREYLVRNGLGKFESIPVSKYIRERISGYYKTLRQAETDMDVTGFVVYMLNVFEEALSI